MEKILNDEQLLVLQNKIDEAKTVACVCHVNPDGDALGSTLSVAAWMKSLGKECTVIVPNRFPDFLQWMPGASAIVRYDKHAQKADAIFTVLMGEQVEPRKEWIERNAKYAINIDI